MNLEHQELCTYSNGFSLMANKNGVSLFKLDRELKPLIYPPVITLQSDEREFVTVQWKDGLEKDPELLLFEIDQDQSTTIQFYKDDELKAIEKSNLERTSILEDRIQISQREYQNFKEAGLPTQFSPDGNVPVTLKLVRILAPKHPLDEKHHLIVNLRIYQFGGKNSKFLLVDVSPDTNKDYEQLMPIVRGVNDYMHFQVRDVIVTIYVGKDENINPSLPLYKMSIIKNGKKLDKIKSSPPPKLKEDGQSSKEDKVSNDKTAAATTVSTITKKPVDWKKYAIIGGTVALVAIIVYLLIMMSSKKKKEEEK